MIYQDSTGRIRETYKYQGYHCIPNAYCVSDGMLMDMIDKGTVTLLNERNRPRDEIIKDLKTAKG